MGKKAIIAGASGLIGSALLTKLLAAPEYEAVLVLVRKKLPVDHPKLTQRVIDFDRLNDYSASIAGNAVFSCLGSTRQQTPDQNQYWKIDHDYPVEMARIAATNGVAQFHLISSVGAKAAAKNSYLHMKGVTEEDVAKAGLKALFIYRPSQLVGDRVQPRLGERIGKAVMAVFNPVLFGGLKKFRSVRATTVAERMLANSLREASGEEIVYFEG